jgi:hypothetical protein
MEGSERLRAPTDGELRQLGFSFHVPEVEEVEVFVVDDEGTSLELMEAFVRRIGHPVKAFSELGVSQFLTKPLELDHLLRALQRAYLKRSARPSRSSWVSPSRKWRPCASRVSSTTSG